ncbi:nucleolar pre-ribosomal-associated protein 1, partial [Biomphalaria glabrata]
MYFTFNQAQHLIDSNVKIEADPPVIVGAMATNVDVQCSFNRDQSLDMAAVSSITLAHSNSTGQRLFIYIASVNAVDRHAHNLTNGVQVLSGSDVNSVTGQSTLRIRFKYPESNYLGAFLCEVNGFDQIGRPITKYALSDVLPYNLSDVLNLINSLKSCNSNHLDFIDSLIRTLYPKLESNFYPPLLYNGHKYYLSSSPMRLFNYTKAQLICGEFGGYIAELDSHEEYLFVTSYIENYINSNLNTWIYTGAIVQNGVWINSHSAAAETTFDWSPGQPTSSREANCQCFLPSSILALGSCNCFDSVPGDVNDKNSYMCEIAYDKC